MYGLDATVRRAVIAIAGLGSALTLATSARAQGGGSDERAARRDTMVVRLRASTVEQQLIRARIESLIRKFQAEQLSASDRAELRERIDSLAITLADLMRGAAEASAGLAEGMARGLGPARAPARRIDISRAESVPDYVLKGWIGLNAQGLQMPPRLRDGEIFLRYMEYPKVLTVDANSPAARAGIVKGDLLIAYDGEDLRENEINLTRLLQPMRQLKVTVDRDGERRDYPLVVAKAPQNLLVRRMESGLIQFDDSAPAAPVRVYAGPRRGGAGGRGTAVEPSRGNRIYMIPPVPPDTVTMPAEPPRLFVMRGFADGFLGAQTAVVDAELGESFGVDAGVLLTHVAEPSPARNSGLRSGDVIVRANGEDVTSIAQLRRIIASAGDDRHLELKVVRQKKPMTMTLRW